MLIAVLVLALFGLWTPILVTLYIFRDMELERLIDESAKQAAKARHPSHRRRGEKGLRYACPVCGTESIQRAVTDDGL